MTQAKAGPPIFSVARAKPVFARLVVLLGTALAAGCGGGAGSPARDAGADVSTGGQPGTGGTGTGGAGAGSGGAGGAVNQTCVPPASIDTPVAKLTQTGCVDPARPTMLAASVIPYEVNSPLWSDGADKVRGMAIPTGKKVHVKNCAAEPTACGQGAADDGKWVFPVGTVLVKHFGFDDKLVETRLFIRFDESTWAGFSYQWNEAQTEAMVVPDDRVKVSFNTGKRTVEWHYPNRIDCTKCHTREAGWSLGPETAQLNRTVGGTNQIDRIAALGVLDAAPPKPYKAALVAPYPSQAGSPAASATLEQRARSYLHANCANCHRPDGEYADIDLRYDTAFKNTGVCGVAPMRADLVAGNLHLDPGKPENSVMWLRMNTPPDPQGGKTLRMPQIATYVIDTEGLKVVGDWIKSLAACP